MLNWSERQLDHASLVSFDQGSMNPWLVWEHVGSNGLHGNACPEARQATTATAAHICCWTLTILTN
jgi:hypothetical protein